MTTFLIELPGFLAGYIITARMVFARIRPSKVPVCGFPQGHVGRRDDKHTHAHTGEGWGGHWDWCYTRWAEVTQDWEAALAAHGAAVVWPATALVWALSRIITTHPPETGAEKDERIRELNANIERLQRELERAA